MLSPMLEQVIRYSLGIAFAGLAVGALFYRGVIARPEGSPAMQRLGERMRVDALRVLRREQLVVLGVVLGVDALLSLSLGRATGIAFAAGSAMALLLSWVGVRAATAASVRSIEAARGAGRTGVLHLAFSSGAVTGLAASALGLLGVAALLVWQHGLLAGGGAESKRLIGILAGFAMGAGTVALFARIGAGIFAGSARIGARGGASDDADARPAEHDPRHPAFITERVGAGLHGAAGGVDVFASQAGAMVASVALAVTAAGIADTHRLTALLLPMAYCAAGLVASMLGMLVLRAIPTVRPWTALHAVTLVSTGVFLGLAFLLTQRFQVSAVDADTGRVFAALGPWIAVLAGSLTSLATALYLGLPFAGGSLRTSAAGSRTVAPADVTVGLVVGMRSAIVPLGLVGAAIWVAAWAVGAYGVALAAVGMLATSAISLAVGGCLPIASTAGTEGRATGAAALVALALFPSYASAVGLDTLGLDLLDPRVATGLLLGAVFPLLAAAPTMNAVGEAAAAVSMEVGRQFREIAGLIAGTPGVEPDSARCTDLSANAARRGMILPATASLLLPLVIGKFLGVEALGGAIVGATVAGAALALFLANAGAAWVSSTRAASEGVNGMVRLLAMGALALAPWFVG